MSTIPVTKSGIAETERPNIVIPLSVGRPYRSPAITPPRIEIGTRMTKATNASLKEFWSAGQSTSHAGTCFVSEVPRSPCRSPLHPVDVLRDERPVRAELLVERVDRLLGGERPEHGTPDVARQDARHREDDHAEQDQRDQREADALDEEASH